MNNEEINNSIYSPYIPTIVEDSSITSAFDEIILPLSQPSLTNNWGSNSAVVFEKRFSEFGSSLLQNLESSRIEFDFTISIVGTADTPVNNLNIVNSLLSIGKTSVSATGAVTTCNGGLIDRVEISVNNTIINNNSSNKNFSLAFIERLLMNADDQNEFESIIDSANIGSKDYIWCDSDSKKRYESYLYDNAFRGILTEDSLIYKTLCDIPHATENMKIHNGVVEYIATTTTEVRINKSIPLKWLIDIFVENKFTTSQSIDQLGIKLFFNPPEYLSDGNRFTFNGCRMIIDRHMLNSIVTRKLSDFNEESRKCKFVSKSVMIDIPDSTGFYSADVGGFADSFGSRSIDGVQNPTTVVLWDFYTSRNGLAANQMFQHIPAKSMVESLNGSEINGYTIPFVSAMNTQTKYDIYKSCLQESKKPFSKKAFQRIGSPVIIKNPSVSQSNTLISTKDGNHIGVSVKNVPLAGIANLESTQFTLVSPNLTITHTTIAPTNIRRYIICNIDNCYYMTGRIARSNIAPSGLRLISGSQNITSAQYDEAIDSGYLTLDASQVYIVRDS